jgi:hypothetical protein
MNSIVGSRGWRHTRRNGDREVAIMSHDDAQIDLFDEDVDTGEEAPEGDELTTEEIEAIKAGQADPDTPAPDAEVS